MTHWEWSRKKYRMKMKYSLSISISKQEKDKQKDTKKWQKNGKWTEKKVMKTAEFWFKFQILIKTKWISTKWIDSLALEILKLEGNMIEIEIESFKMCG